VMNSGSSSTGARVSSSKNAELRQQNLGARYTSAVAAVTSAASARMAGCTGAVSGSHAT
jgi:hypothetical protein